MYSPSERKLCCQIGSGSSITQELTLLRNQQTMKKRSLAQIWETITPWPPLKYVSSNGMRRKDTS